MSTRKVIIDVDTGIDDALAISYAIHSKKLDVLGIISTYGNVTVDKAIRNTKHILNLNEKSIPVYAGADRPFRKTEFNPEAIDIHGEDGLGSVRLDSPADDFNVLEAVDFLYEQVVKYPNEITLICVGPLSTLRYSLEEYPDITRLIKKVIIMGGAIDVPGNVTTYAEANIYQDIEAADYIVKSGLPLTLVGLDVTMKTLLSSKILQEWRSQGSNNATFLAEITEYYMNAYEILYPGYGGCALHDPLAIGILIDSTFVETEVSLIKIIPEGERKGETIRCNVKETTTHTPIEICTKVDAEKFVKHFLNTVV